MAAEAGRSAAAATAQDREVDMAGADEDVDIETDSDTDSEKDVKAAPGILSYKCKPRRKASQRPESSDQKRQAFSKRKRGIVLKAYQLYKLTDAKVFVFVVNDKNTSWAYASPGFGAALSTQHLKQMRDFARLPNNPKSTTEVMNHPVKNNELLSLSDDRDQHVRHEYEEASLHQASHHAVPASIPVIGNPGPSTARHSSHIGQDHHPAEPFVSPDANPIQKRSSYKPHIQLPADDDPHRDEPAPDNSIITPSGRRMAAAVGINLHSGSLTDDLPRLERAAVQQRPQPQQTQQSQQTVYMLDSRAHPVSHTLVATRPRQEQQVIELQPDRGHTSAASESALQMMSANSTTTFHAGQVLSGPDGQLYRILSEVPSEMVRGHLQYEPQHVTMPNVQVALMPMQVEGGGGPTAVPVYQYPAAAYPATQYVLVQDWPTS